MKHTAAMRRAETDEGWGMRVALVADIHGNLAALEAVLAALVRDCPGRYAR